MKLFVLSDVHSFYNEMMTALTEKGFDINNKNHAVVICGDLFDRGPDAVKCFEFVKGLAADNRLFYVKGNHEELLLDCMEEILRDGYVNSHHVHNGTVDTVVQFSGFTARGLISGAGYHSEKLANAMQELVDFINDNCIDVLETKTHVFCHGWIPCDPIVGEVKPNWDTEEADWESARWINGMSAWKRGARLPNKTIVCGHWHASWGHSHLHMTHKEFPQKNRTNWQDAFKPFVDEGIVALDACTVYSGMCNCLVVETE